MNRAAGPLAACRSFGEGALDIDTNTRDEKGLGLEQPVHQIYASIGKVELEVAQRGKHRYECASGMIQRGNI